MKCPHCNKTPKHWYEWVPLENQDDNCECWWCISHLVDPYSQDLEMRQLTANHVFYVCPKCGETVT